MLCPNQKSGVGILPAIESSLKSRKLEAESRKLEAESRKLEAGSRKLEAGSWKSQVASWKLEVASRKLEAYATLLIQQTAARLSSGPDCLTHSCAV